MRPRELSAAFLFVFHRGLFRLLSPWQLIQESHMKTFASARLALGAGVLFLTCSGLPADLKWQHHFIDRTLPINAQG